MALIFDTMHGAPRSRVRENVAITHTKAVAAYCASGYRASTAISILKQEEFRNRLL